MQVALVVLAIAVAGAVMSYGVARLLVWSLVRILRWRSAFRLSAVITIWFVASALLMLPLYATLILSVVIDGERDGLFFAWVVGCHTASFVPFGVYLSRHRDRIVRAGKEALIA